jgi:LPS-assembly lipoprotein
MPVSPPQAHGCGDHHGVVASLVFIAAIFCLCLSGCGWHLRGSQTFAVTLPPMQLQIQQGSADLKRELTQTLETSGVELRADAGLILVIHRENQGRRVLSVDSNGKVSEYELQYELLFSLRQVSGEILIDNEHVSQQRDYQFNDSAVLAKSEEERQLFAFMRSTSIQSLLRQLQTVVATKDEIPAATQVPADAN